MGILFGTLLELWERQAVLCRFGERSGVSSREGDTSPAMRSNSFREN